MAWADGASIGTGQNKASSTTVVITTSATAAAGTVVVVMTAWDNVDTASGTPTRLSVTDSAGNTYTRIRERVSANGAAEDGIHVGMFYSLLTSQLTSGGTITVTSDTAAVAKSAAARKFTIGAGNTVAVDQTVDNIIGSGSGTQSMAVSGLASAARLYIRVTAFEAATSTFSVITTNFTGWTGTASSGGSGTTNAGCAGEFRINTSTGETSAPTGGTSEQASVMVALSESAAAAADLVKPPMMVGQAVQRASSW